MQRTNRKFGWHFLATAFLSVTIMSILLLLFAVYSYYNNPQAILVHSFPNFQSIKPAVSITATATTSRTPFLPLPTNTVTPTPTSTSTLTPSPTPTNTATPIPSPTPLPTNTPLPTETPLPPPENPFPNDEANISNINGHAQLYTLDCEARSAVDLAGYFGIAIDENDFLANMPYSENPEEGFVGSFTAAQGRIPPSSYGIYAAPVAALLRAYGLNAEDQRNFSWDQLRTEISSGRPVMAWVINNTLSGSPRSFTTSGGQNVTVANYEHTVLVIGYDSSSVTLLDGSWVYRRTTDQFLDSWGVLGNMAVTVGDPAKN